jgi:hypothetical protein
VADQEKIIAQRLQDHAELTEREKQEAVNTVNAKHFEETQRLTGKLEDLARQLERKTANELGEGLIPAGSARIHCAEPRPR